ncbi:hypothetical protein SAMN06265371_103457 [Lutibacter agarilyticus]|uniref:Uncharacterized protein n=1 Tax=Lutibacter agarilyticus TaxID=1109740 RepID=A0A238WQH5_9FLAO|nr:hypothetical protein [Lutibacter agarilyticus]SNR48583.1 hypothetical protein SAMN06265371_103457 [Lutibacter agarilyticus]
MKKKLFLLMLLLTNIISHSQIFQSENNDFINFNSKEIKINIDNTNYEGNFISFTSKEDKKEYLIYSYFSRSVVIELNKETEEINDASPNLTVYRVKLIHTSNIDSLMKEISKKGLNNIKKYIIIYEAENIRLELNNQNKLTP